MDETNSYIKAKHYWLWIPAGIILALAAWIFLGNLNRELFLYINGWSRYTGENTWAFLTILSDGIVTAILLLPFIRRKPEIIWAGIIAGLSFTVVSEILKANMEVSRPPRVFAPGEFILIGPKYNRHSFPSGHAAMIMTIAAIFTFYVRPVWLRLLVMVSGTTIALSRIVVGVHWPLDVLIGSFLGWVLAWPGLMLAHRWKWGSSVPMMRLAGGIMLAGCIVLLFPYTKFYQIIWHQRILATVFFVVGLKEYIKLWQKKGVPTTDDG